MTLGEKIRNMNNEELSDFIFNIIYSNAIYYPGDFYIYLEQCGEDCREHIKS